MPNNIKSKSVPDRVNFPLRYWAKQFGVTRNQLKEAVKKVGPRVVDVARELKSKSARGPFFDDVA